MSSSSCITCRNQGFIELRDWNPECNGCALLQKTIRPYTQVDAGYLGEHRTISIGKKNHGSTMYAMTLQDDIGLGSLTWEGYDVKLTLFAIPDEQNPWNIKIPGCDGLDKTASLHQQDPVSNLGETTGSLPTKELAKRWLQECEQWHGTSCWRKHQTIPSRNNPPLPFRVLEIGKDSKSMVILREGIDTDDPYMCLSYCWGNEDERIMATTTTKEYHERGLLPKDLPLLYQQFIEVAQFFGVPYIWIDALCIIQDDNEDWKKEAGKMAQIYSNSWLTVAATAASGPQQSLFRARNMTKVQENGVSMKVQVKRHFPNSPRINDPQAIFPLLKRGWICQERLLSPRLLHFGPDEITWECFDQRRCECGETTHLLDEIEKKKLIKYSDQLESQQDTRRVGNFWRSIVIQYTNLFLSEPKDRLYALHGVLQKVGAARQKASDDMYFAGLWKNTLPFDLLWYVSRPDSTGCRTRKRLSKAPTWSWASVDAPVTYEQPLYCSPELEIKEVCQATIKDGILTDALSSEIISPLPITLKCRSLKIAEGQQIPGFVYWDDDSIPRHGEVYICLIAWGKNGKLDDLHAILLQGQGEVFIRVGAVTSLDDGISWSESTFVIV